MRVGEGEEISNSRIPVFPNSLILVFLYSLIFKNEI